MVDEFQLLEARANGADAVLLILSALDDTEFLRFHERSRELGLDALCEVHDENELHRALNLGAEIIGVNNRDLRTFEVDLGTAERRRRKSRRRFCASPKAASRAAATYAGCALADTMLSWSAKA